ncbi:hypothetical protein ZOSMA_134G00170 [Zostera marina]|uniref:Uncharacterized protein n=1 Tax=Zostera marina TaxID=29655 RepID=A0A0K9PYS8_ZOSMR|nr:hypothetical protein ZOSMA_134G00170 [Zostera marina]
MFIRNMNAHSKNFNSIKKRELTDENHEKVYRVYAEDDITCLI